MQRNSMSYSRIIFSRRRIIHAFLFISQRYVLGSVECILDSSIKISLFLEKTKKEYTNAIALSRKTYIRLNGNFFMEFQDSFTQF
jgi:hypothetical protein